jgi:leucyl/phenylalanyl-tRNA--protein transferase
MARPLPWLDDTQLEFPDPKTALKEPNGLLAVGGDLSCERLLRAYRQGIFPWYSEGEPILWWSPDPRVVIFPGHLHISRSLKKTLSQQKFTFTYNRAFADVIRACSEPRAKQSGTWITPKMQEAYIQLHQRGFAQSLECWQGNKLVGGIYGVVLGKCFFGESMFSRVSNASKAVLVELDSHLQTQGFILLDCQVSSDHILSMGAVEIPRQHFLQYIRKGLEPTEAAL